MRQIPKKQNAKFKELVTGQLVIEIENFFLRTKLNQVRDQIEKVEISINEGVDFVYKTCVELIKNNDLSSKDIETIFGKQENLLKKEKQIEIHTKAEEEDDSITINTTGISQKINKIKEEAESRRKVLEGKFSKSIIDEDFESRITKHEKEKQLWKESKTKKEENSESFTNHAELKEIVDTDNKKDLLKKKRLLTEKRREASIKRRNEDKRAEKEKLNKKSKDSSLSSFLKSFLGAM